MGTVSSSVGLISGLDIESIVKQLIAIESKPLALTKSRIANVTAQQAAYTALGSNLSSIKSSLSNLTSLSKYRQKTASSSDESVVSVSAASRTAVGSYSFQVKSLVTTHQLVSRGFVDKDRTPVGAGTLVFKNGQGFVNDATSLDALNGYDGVRRGTIRIADRSGQSATFDLRAASTVNDVIEAINSESSISVRARTSGDTLIIEDITGLSTGSLRIEDVNGGHMAEDLGIAGTATSGSMTSSDLISMDAVTPLSELNDGIGLRYNANNTDLKFTLSDGSEYFVNFSNYLRYGTDPVINPPDEPVPGMPSTYLGQLNDGRGVRTGENGELQIRITNRNGDTGVVDLTGAETIEDVRDILKNAKADDGVTDLKVEINSLNSDKLVIKDNSEGDGNLVIEDVEGAGFAATDLGIAIDTEKESFTGTSIYRLESVGALMAAIRYSADVYGNVNGPDGKLQVAISDDGNGLVFTDTTGGTATVTAMNGSNAVKDLGLENGFDTSGMARSRSLLAGMNTVLLSSLNGGNGVETGSMTFQLKDNSQVTFDFTNARTLQDVIDVINADGRLEAQVSSGGIGLVIEDNTTGSGTFGIMDENGEPPQMAQDLGLYANSKGQVASDDLKLQFVNENTLLSELNNGDGIGFGNVQMTDSTGATQTLVLHSAAHKTVGDVIEAINDLDFGLKARINAEGDGIELYDTAGGDGTILVEDLGEGTAAEDLRLAGQSDEGAINGRFTQLVEIDGDDTLTDLQKKINDANIGMQAGIINDGSGYKSYRLMVTSKESGLDGRLGFSSGNVDIGLDTMTQARDATVLIGDPSSANSIVITSSTNTITDAVDGLTLNLVGTSPDPVDVTVKQDVDSVVSNVSSLIDAFNKTIENIDKSTSYNAETEERGVLLGDGTVSLIRSRLFSVATARTTDEENDLRVLSQVGITTSEGKLVLDEERFRTAFEQDPEAVANLLAKTKVVKDENDEDKLVNVGIFARLNEELANMTTIAGGTLTRKKDALQDQIELLNDRAGNLQDLLDAKEARLYAEFQAMESALSQLQTQQTALSSLSQLASSMQ